jgi:NAD(P)-dependent dehydrogenase (short-subunit alcohol dehydrogenase family)
MAKKLEGKIAIVAGATRGAGRGIARMLGEAGATVICSGRSTRGDSSPIDRPETIDETAEMIEHAGGVAIPIRTDHANVADVEALCDRIVLDHGQIDILVNDIGGEGLSDWKPVWESDLETGLELIDTAVRTHVITARVVTPRMVEKGSGLIVEVTDGDHAGYRGAFFYDLAKNGAIRLGFALSQELKPKGITALSVTPGFLRSEAMLENFGVTEDNWRDAAEKVRGFSESETPCYVGRAIVALAADKNVHEKSGGVFASWELAKEYGFRDIDGRQPDWWGYVRQSIGAILDQGGPTNDDESFWVNAWRSQLAQDERFTQMCDRIDDVVGRN